MTEKEKLDAMLANDAEKTENLEEQVQEVSDVAENLVQEQAQEEQIKEALTKQPEQSVQPEQPKQPRKLLHDVKTGRLLSDMQHDNDFLKGKQVTRLGESIYASNEIREGWIPVDRELLGDRGQFYPAEWEFRIRPATVEAIRNWSTIDEENINAVDNVFNEVIKSCVSIHTPEGPKPWGNINSWDRFFFLLLVREYTFAHGEKEIKYDEPCPECDNDVTFRLTSQSLMYDMPDPEVMKMFDQVSMKWVIDPREYDLDEDVLTFYLPTLEKDANIKEWLIRKLRQSPNAKIDQVFLRILPWMSPKISKDETIAKRQIRELEMKYKSWDVEMFSFVDEVIKNIVVQPLQKLVMKCPICGEEVTSQIRFPNSIRDIFNVSNKHKKFGTK